MPLVPNLPTPEGREAGAHLSDKALDALENKANSASGDEWGYWNKEVHVKGENWNATRSILRGSGGHICSVNTYGFSDSQEAKNGRFIAAASPAVVRALIQEVRRLRRQSAATPPPAKEGE